MQGKSFANAQMECLKREMVIHTRKWYEFFFLSPIANSFFFICIFMHDTPVRVIQLN